MTKFSAHQKRVIGALAALEEHHHWPFWDRDSIGHVVAAGGFHGTIQKKTIAILKGAGLMQTERASWSPEVADRIRCSCSCCTWGLTLKGRALAARLNIRWPEDAKERVAKCWVQTCFWDEDEPPPGLRDFGDDDDDDGDDDQPKSPTPVSPHSLVLV